MYYRVETIIDYVHPKAESSTFSYDYADYDPAEQFYFMQTGALTKHIGTQVTTILIAAVTLFVRREEFLPEEILFTIQLTNHGQLSQQGLIVNYRPVTNLN